VQVSYVATAVAIGRPSVLSRRSSRNLRRALHGRWALFWGWPIRGLTPPARLDRVARWVAWVACRGWLGVP